MAIPKTAGQIDANGPLLRREPESEAAAEIDL
jgi:hypothetical protein